MALKHVGQARFVDDEPLTLKQVKEAAPLEWVPGLERFSIFSWVEFPSLERASYGLLAVETGSIDPAAEVRAGTLGFEPSTIAPLTELAEALTTLERGERYLVEEFPFSEITEEQDYQRAVVACIEHEGLKESPLEWSPKGTRGEQYRAQWKGPGVYDMRECPPLKTADSVEEHELGGMEYEAGETLEYMFQGDEWKESLKKLLRELGGE